MKTSINSELSNNNCRCDCRMPYFIRLKGSQTFDDGTYINNGGNEHPHHPHHNHVSMHHPHHQHYHQTYPHGPPLASLEHHPQHQSQSSSSQNIIS